MRRAVTLAVALTVLVAAVPAMASGPWQMRKHHPAANVLAMAQTADGYLWFGSRAGLVRFDGVRFVNFDRTSDPPFPYASIVGMVVAQDGALWMATEGAGILRLADGKVTQYDKDDGLPGNGLVGIVEDGEGRLWSATASRIFYRDKDGSIVVFKGEDQGVPNAALYHMWPDAQGNVIFESAGLWTRTRGAELFLDREQPDETERMKYMLKSSWKHRALNRDELILDIDSYNPKSVFRVGEELWVANNGRVVRIKDDQIEQVVGQEKLGGNIETVFLDREHNLWVAITGQGVVQLWRSNVRTAANDDFLPASPIFGMARDPEGGLYLVPGGQLIRIDGRKKTVWDDTNGFPTYTSRSIAIAKSGDIWITTLERYLVGFRDGVFTKHLFPDEDTSVSSSTVTIDHDGGVWMGTNAGTLFHMPTGSDNLTTAASVPFDTSDCRGVKGNCPGNIRVLATDHDGTIVVGTTRRGVWRLDPAEGKLRADERVPPDESIRAMIPAESSDRLWVGTEEGLIVLSAKGAHRISSQNGLPHDNALHLVEDGIGHLWIAGDKGVYRLAIADIDAFVAGKIETVATVSYDAGDGLPSDEHFRGWGPGAARDGHGNLWFATLGGPAVMTPDSEPAAALPDLRFEHIAIDDHSFDLRSGSPVVAPPGRNDTEIAYTLPFFATPHRVTFRYRLAGLNEQWTEAANRRLANFTNLPPGDYRFEVQAIDKTAGRRSAVATMGFTIKPHFHQTWMFLALIAVVVVALALFVQRLRVRQVGARYQAVIDERLRISRDLHDTLAQVFSAVGFHIDALDGKVDTADGGLRDRLAQARRVVDHGRLAARAVIRNLRGETQSLQGALEELRGFYEGVPILLTVEGTPIAFPTAAESEMLFIAQEAVSNAIEHGKAEHVTIELAYPRNGRPSHGTDNGHSPGNGSAKEPAVSLFVRDDGQGMAAMQGGEPGHFGLLGMQERAKRAGGRLEISSEPGVGTEIGVVIDDPPSISG